MNNIKKIKISLSPHNNLNKLSLLVIGLIIFLFFIIFSIIWLSIGAWPITIFMGAEYIILSYLGYLFYKNRKVKEDIYINEENITYNFYKKEKLIKQKVFNLYWTKISFWKKDNESKLILSQSNQSLEVGKFLHSDPKEEVYQKLNKYKKKSF